MNQSYTGAIPGHAGSVTPLEVKIPPKESTLESLSEKDHECLLQYLLERLNQGVTQRDKKLARYSKIDRLISTWQKLNKEDSLREIAEENSGRQQALPMNLPLLATHLEDTVSFFSEVFAPVSGVFFTSDGSPQQKELAKRMNQDAKARNFYGELCMTLRSLIKYNIGGFHVEWETVGQQGTGVHEAGNRWTALNVYNTLWDPTIKDVSKISNDGEWAAFVEEKNRVWLARRALAGELARVDRLFDCDSEERSKSNVYTSNGKRVKYFRPPPANAGLPTDALDERTTANVSGQQPVNWASFGAGLGDENLAEIQGFEIVTMYCWLTPCKFGLLSDQEEKQIEDLGINKESLLELWKFKVGDARQILYAEPVVDRNTALQQDSTIVNSGSVVGGQAIPMHFSFMTQDQMEEAQRSIMELMRGFQRLSSYLVNVYIAGLRKNVWGVTGVDKSMFDPSKLMQGDVAGVLVSKIPGRDVRTGMHQLNNTAGTEQAISSLDSVFAITQKLFPSQGLPSQVAGIDRAIKDQVAATMQGATRRLHMLARLLDSSLMNPARMSAFGNILTHDSRGLDGIKDEEVAAVFGSGIQSLEAERVAGIVHELLVTLMQNPESAQRYDVAGLMSYWSKVRNAGVDLGQFARQQAANQVTPGAPDTTAGGETGPGVQEGGPGPEDILAMMGQG